MSTTSIVLVHLGLSKPGYINDCVHQIRLWHDVDNTDVYLIADAALQPHFSDLCARYNVDYVSTDSLIETDHHGRFLQEYSNYDSVFREGYWRFVVERFFFLEELLLQRQIESAVYIEYDVMLYQNLNQIQGQLENQIEHMALCFDNDWQGYPSFIVVNNANTLGHLNRYVLQHCNSGKTDMKLMSAYARHFPENLRSLPQISKKMFDGRPERKTLLGHAPRGSAEYLYETSEALDDHIFDAIALGQYLCGIDPRNKAGKYLIKYRNNSSFYTIDEIQPEWKRNADGLWYLQASDGTRIANLHVHSKKLDHFFSDRPDQPLADYTDGEIVVAGS